MKIQPVEKPIADPNDPPDNYLEWGCCINCDETRKDYLRGLQRNVWFNGKFYSCVCFDCLCSKCCWYLDGTCERKIFDDYGLAT